MSKETSTDCVSQEMFAVLHGQEMPLLTRWSYRADDPYAVTMSISRPSGRWINWLMARDLVVEGMLASAGLGDVRVAPFSDEEFDIIEVKIGDDEGFASLEFDRDLMERFLAATFEVVELGAESDVIDVAAEIEKITNSCPG
jgi:hypothetical protein